MGGRGLAGGAGGARPRRAGGRLPGPARRPLGLPERLGFVAAGLLLVFPALLDGLLPAPHWLGLGLAGALLLPQFRVPARPVL
ncbi:hypothetical protein [Teichococcus aestuarii]|uniref:hypothetical protein n=1 Tax=Teichococcus aestuarii TaxID=568898 RepID=UPI00361CACC1